MILESWLPVLDYEGRYLVSDVGRVRATNRFGDNLVKTPILANGYRCAILRRDGRRAYKSIHSLVCEAFHGRRPEGMVVRHLDGDNLNNCADNLAWGTRSENIRDSVRHGTHALSRRTHCKNGHPLSGDNLYIAPNRSRVCRTCNRVWVAARKARLKAAARAITEETT